MVTSRWSVRHGDTAHSEVWAVLDVGGAELDLDGDGWVVRAQARETADSPRVLRQWDTTNGVELGTATVRLASGRRVTTTTVQLVLHPGDYQYLPLTWSGVFDVEIELPSVDDDDPPQRRHTIVDDGHLTIYPGVTRA